MCIVFVLDCICIDISGRLFIECLVKLNKRTFVINNETKLHISELFL